MYKFIKTKDRGNDFDNSDVMVVMKSSEVNLDEMFEHFKNFLIACGFAMDSSDTIQIVKENEYIESSGEPDEVD